MPYWIWICVIVGAVIIEALTMDVVSIWFTIGAIVPLILSATNACGWEIQVIVFIIISAVLILTLRKVTMKFDSGGGFCYYTIKTMPTWRLYGKLFYNEYDNPAGK